MVYLKPGRTSRWSNAVVGKLGVKPTLLVAGRRSGEIRKVPVNVLSHDGRRYLVAPRGETEWVRNLRAAGQAEIRTRKASEEVTATEVPADQRAEIIAAYRSKWEKETKAFWKALPDPADHLVFEIS